MFLKNFRFSKIWFLGYVFFILGKPTLTIILNLKVLAFPNSSFKLSARSFFGLFCFCLLDRGKTKRIGKKIGEARIFQ